MCCHDRNCLKPRIYSERLRPDTAEAPADLSPLSGGRGARRSVGSADLSPHVRESNAVTATVLPQDPVETTYFRWSSLADRNAWCGELPVEGVCVLAGFDATFNQYVHQFDPPACDFSKSVRSGPAAIPRQCPAPPSCRRLHHSDSAAGRGPDLWGERTRTAAWVAAMHVPLGWSAQATWSGGPGKSPPVTAVHASTAEAWVPSTRAAALQQETGAAAACRSLVSRPGRHWDVCWIAAAPHGSARNDTVRQLCRGAARHTLAAARCSRTSRCCRRWVYAGVGHRRLCRQCCRIMHDGTPPVKSSPRRRRMLSTTRTAPLFGCMRAAGGTACITTARPVARGVTR